MPGSRRFCHGKRAVCTFCGLYSGSVLSHFVRYHASDPNFHVLCGINGCSKTYRNCIRSFIFVCGPLHYHAMNGQAAEQENGTNDMNSDSSASEMDEDSG